MKILEEIRRKWKPRLRTSHKGDFGRVFILAGSKGLTGAAYLSAAAAVRSGAGLVTLGVPESVYPVLARRHAEVMVKPFPPTRSGSFSYKALRPALEFARNQDVLAMGPGLSQNKETQKFARSFLQWTDKPVVIDADGLNALRGHLNVLKKCRGRAILTPHPGEFIRLFGGKLTNDGPAREKRALEAAKNFGVTVILKGHQTVVASPSGKVFVNKTGNPGMAKGGTGDILTGMVAALLGQKISFWDAACFAVYAHGLAGDQAAKKQGQIGMLAGDILRELPGVWKKLLRR